MILRRFIASAYLRQPGNLAYYDALTGCRNQNYLQRIGRKKYDEKDCYVTFFDVNEFKHINDTKGHEVGNSILAKVGEMLQSFSENDKESVAIRYGGDEFILITSQKPCENIFDGYYVDGTLLSHATVHKLSTQTLCEAIHYADIEMLKNKDELYNKGILKNRRKSIFDDDVDP